MIVSQMNAFSREQKVNTRSGVVMAALLFAAVGCGDDDTGSPTGPSAPTPALSVSAAGALSFKQVSGGGNHSCGLTFDNKAYCWGWNDFGQLGDGSASGPEFCNGAVGPFSCSTRPVLVAGGHSFQQISAGSAHTCAVTTDNRAFCWGSNVGQLGDGTRTTRRAPVAVAGGHQFRLVDAGNDHTCAVTTGNRAYCWGLNGDGNLGDGTQTNRFTPVAVAGGLSFTQVSAGVGVYRFTCGVTSDYRGFCWGRNNSGQLGDSSEAHLRVRPSLVAGKRQFRGVDAGYEHACGVTTGDRVYCWGNGRRGALGNGKTYLSFWPRAVSGGLFFATVTAGHSYSCGVTTSQKGYCWGFNSTGELGNGTTTGTTTPVPVSGGLSLTQVNTSGNHTCARTTGSRAYCWGYGFFGQLGNGTSGFGAEAHSPVQVLGPR
jgi:alpha-tubulin suppressor-like RCC1 family protein